MVALVAAAVVVVAWEKARRGNSRVVQMVIKPLIVTNAVEN